MNQSSRVSVSRGSQVHQVPQDTRAHNGPVRSMIVQKTMPPSAAANAAMSSRSSLSHR